MLPPYLDQLSPEQQEVFKQLKQFSDRFVLAGGTAIMLQIGHRMSFDFDCFSLTTLPRTFLQKIKRVFSKIVLVSVETSEQVTFKTKEGVGITFVHHPYKPLKNVIETSFMPLFHLDDLAANKAYTIGRRDTWRDYVDLFFLLKWRLYTLSKIIALGTKKFGGEFNEKLFLGQLTYFDDLDIVPTEFLKDSYTPAQIQSFLEKEVEVYVRKVLP